MTRNGKIAHLSSLLRDKLNRRLDNGEEGDTLLDWLNGLPEVQENLKLFFEGAPISKQNLSEWRQGGFREWLIRNELIEQAYELSDAANDMEEYCGYSPTGRPSGGAVRGALCRPAQRLGWRAGPAIHGQVAPAPRPELRHRPAAKDPATGQQTEAGI
jgi:hypothetical protein